MNTLILHLSLIKGIGPVTIAHFIEQLERHMPGVNPYQLKVSDCMQLGFTFKISELIVAGLHDETILDEELQLYKKYNIQWMTYKDSHYPEMLKHIYAPPSVITWRGNIGYDKALAVVGSRDATEYGKYGVEFFVPQLVEQGYAIVSGGAYGIDAWAHEAALRTGGKTIVVLGSGLAKPYPREHIKLFDKVVEQGGALLSIFSIMTPASPGNFPARNRVIAGLSQGCIVIQAALQSGAKITADYALQQGRSVFAIPGPFNHPLSEGCNDLIKQGATMLTSFDDIAQEFGITQYRKAIVTSDVHENEKQFLRSEDEPVRSVESKKEKKDHSTQMDNPIVDACKIPQCFDDLLKQFPDRDAAELQNILFDLSLEGAIEQDFSGMWKSRFFCFFFTFCVSFCYLI